ncbi:MAG: hypothetical protein HOO96_08035, partial [Polyangiaceae bacterium]|nr:hypothetical protein [Polyangiaceae bacterium]
MESCSFPEVDKLGKTCEGSCAPYYCVDGVCVASPSDGAVAPFDAAKPGDAADAGPPGPCTPKPYLDGGRIVFRDCFDDREPSNAVGLGTPWPNGTDQATLDPTRPVSSPYSLRFRSNGIPTSANTGPIFRGGESAKEVACAFYVRFEALAGKSELFELITSLVSGDLTVALAATPSGSGLVWRPRYSARFDGGTPTIVDTTLASPRTDWIKVSMVMGPGSVVVRVGDTSQVLGVGPTSNIVALGVRIGVLTQ